MISAVVRFVISALVLLLVGFIVPGFAVADITSALVAALVITLLVSAVDEVLGENASPQNRGLVSFFVAAAVIWGTQFVVTGFEVTVLGALIASVAIGLIDTLVPTTLR